VVLALFSWSRSKDEEARLEVTVDRVVRGDRHDSYGVGLGGTLGEALSHLKML